MHPYRGATLEAPPAAADGGAVAVKWLPSAMNIDPLDSLDPRCVAFYTRLRELGMPLIVHGGAEHAVVGPDRQAFNPPLRTEPVLERTLRLVTAAGDTLRFPERVFMPPASLFPRVPGLA